MHMRIALVLLLCGLVVPLGAEDAPSVEWDGSLLVQLAVSDLDASIGFYRDVLGWTLEARVDELRWARIRPDRSDVIIGIGESRKGAGSGTLTLNFGVIDIDRARATLESRGVVFEGETITIPGVVRLATFRDPDGNRFRLAEDIGAGDQSH